MEWYNNEHELAGAVDFLLQYNCCFGWTAIASDKTPCCDYKEGDQDIPEELRQALRNYFRSLTKKKRCNLNRQVSLLLGERFYVRESAIIKIISRILSAGDPRQNKEMIAFTLQMQIEQRMNLLKTLETS